MSATDGKPGAALVENRTTGAAKPFRKPRLNAAEGLDWKSMMNTVLMTLEVCHTE